MIRFSVKAGSSFGFCFCVGALVGSGVIEESASLWGLVLIPTGTRFVSVLDWGLVWVLGWGLVWVLGWGLVWVLGWALGVGVGLGTDVGVGLGITSFHLP